MPSALGGWHSRPYNKLHHSREGFSFARPCGNVRPALMLKSPALSLALCLGLAGCHVFERSAAWTQASRVRPGETSRDPDPSSAYAAKLHQAFAERGMEHKVVLYQYRYTTRRHEEAIGTRTAVIYRDSATPRHPWWLKDDRLITPFWLPNGSLDKQLSFYLRRPAEVLEQTDYPARSGDGKATVALARPGPVTRIVPVRPAPTPPPPVFVEQSKEPASPVADLEELFHAEHGTPYDPASPTDRRKMEQLRRAQ